MTKRQDGSQEESSEIKSGIRLPRTLILNLLTSRTVRTLISIVESTQAVVLGWPKKSKSFGLFHKTAQ